MHHMKLEQCTSQLHSDISLKAVPFFTCCLGSMSNNESFKKVFVPLTGTLVFSAFLKNSLLSTLYLGLHMPKMKLMSWPPWTIK